MERTNSFELAVKIGILAIVDQNLGLVARIIEPWWEVCRPEGVSWRTKLYGPEISEVVVTYILKNGT